MSQAEGLVGTKWCWKNTGVFRVQCNWGAREETLEISEGLREGQGYHIWRCCIYPSLRLSSSPSYSLSPPTPKYNFPVFQTIRFSSILRSSVINDAAYEEQCPKMKYQNNLWRMKPTRAHGQAFIVSPTTFSVGNSVSPLKAMSSAIWGAQSWSLCLSHIPLY